MNTHSKRVSLHIVNIKVTINTIYAIYHTLKLRYMLSYIGS